MTENGWNEYKQLMLAEVAENKSFREETRTNFRLVSEALVEIRTERRIGKWLIGVIVPATVAALVTGVAKAMGL